MKQTDTRILSNQAINIMSRLTRGEKPRDLDHAEDLLWEMAAEINNQALAIHQRDVLIEQLSDLVNTKQLTGLLNDRGFESAISKEQNRVDRGQSKGGVIVSIDLAGFKRINDDYNLQIGDLALKKFADVIRDFGFRETDIIGNPGGDEFVIIMTDTELDMPETQIGLSKIRHDFNPQSESLWNKINQFNRHIRITPLVFEYEGKEAVELIRTRISISDYDANVSVKAALAQADERAKLIKQFTKQYVPSGR